MPLSAIGQSDAFLSTHDGTRFVPPPTASAKAAQPAPLPSLKGEELPQKGRLYVDQVGPREFQLTDLVTHEVVHLPPGHWYLQEWDDLDELSLMGCRKGSGEEVELEIDGLLKTKAWREVLAGHSLC